MTISNILKMNLRIPNFQRPYKWSEKNVIELLRDIDSAKEESKKIDNYAYRMGTIILYKNQYGSFDIIDGQQRLLSLSMINYYLDKSFNCTLFDISCESDETKNNLGNNYIYIKDWFSIKNDAYKNEFLSFFKESLEFVVIVVDKLPAAFQLFDSQNNRGKTLEPQDLLKAYHLREMKDNEEEMHDSVNEWEAYNPQKISALFDTYLFPILNWSKKEKTPEFSAKHIDFYKGIPQSSDYTFAKRAKNAYPFFQINEPFNSGKAFFDMVTHYLVLLEEIEMELKTPKFEKIVNIVEKNSTFLKNKKVVSYFSTGFKYAFTLFKCSLLCYYDRFHNFDEQAIKKLFTWALMIRVDTESLGYNTINKYASCQKNDGVYTNNIPMFYEIVNARSHTDIANMKVEIKRNPDCAKVGRWNELYSDLKELNVLEV